MASLPTVLIVCLEPPQAMVWREQLLVTRQLRVGGITNSLGSAAKMLAQHAAEGVLVDLRMLQGTTNGALRSLRSGPNEELPNIVMHAQRLDDPLLLQALRAGADSYHVEGSDPFALAGAVQRALDGESAIAPSIASQVLSLFDRSVPAEADSPMAETPLQLTPAERSLLARLAQGHDLNFLSEADAVSPHALGLAVRGIYRKLRWILRASALSLDLADDFRDSGWHGMRPSTPPRRR